MAKRSTTKAQADAPRPHSGLPRDALEMWLELHETGLEALDRAGALEFRRWMGGGEKAWSNRRTMSAIEDLERAGFLDREQGRLDAPAQEFGTTGYREDTGVLVHVMVKVFSDEEVDRETASALPPGAFEEIAGGLRKTGRPLNPGGRRSLYWCSTDDHGEDWFIVADSAFGARIDFAAHEGYEAREVKAEWVAFAPKSSKARAGTWPSDDLIRACGGEFLPYRPAGGRDERVARATLGVVTKAVRFGDRTFVAGDIVANEIRRFRGRTQ